MGRVVQTNRNEKKGYQFGFYHDEGKKLSRGTDPRQVRKGEAGSRSID